jgi:hypothetical protein
MRWLAVLWLAACTEHGSRGPLDGNQPPDAVVLEESGRACSVGVASGDNDVVIASPALDCPSRICLRIHNLVPDECTARCTTATDCVASPVSACTTSFVCQPVVEVGPFACQSFCVCADRALPAPTSCVTGVQPSR